MSRRISLTAALTTMVLLVAGAASAQRTETPPRKTYQVAPATSEIRVDGSLDEPAWADASLIEIGWEWFPQVNDPAATRTEARITFDQERLYVGFHAFDPNPSEIRAYYADRDTAFSDDTVGIIIDTFNDQRRGFQFRINPLGVQMEGINSDIDNSEDWSWNIIWDSVGKLTPDGYIVEIGIPFSQLRFPRTEGPQTWSILLIRDRPRSVRHRLRSAPLDEDRNCFVCQAEEVSGFRQIEAGRNLELDPTLTAGRTDVRNDFPLGDLQSGDTDVDAGITARWGVTPNITLNAAINPDFSQVEADAAQLDVNTTFALFFPEKRPFFLEGADLFSTPVSAVFTRSIADPIAGLKLTGKEGSNTFGLFATLDEINNIIIPGFERSSRTSLDQEVFASVVRYRRDVGERSTVGGLYAGREGEQGYSNQVYGLDGVYQFSDSDTIIYQALGSTTAYPETVADRFAQPSDSFSGHAVEAQYRHSDRNWFWRVNYEDYSTDFRADSGFVNQVGYRETSFGVQRTFYGGEDSWYRRLGIFAGADKTDQHDGIADEWGADVQVWYQGPMQSYVQFSLAPNDEFYNGVQYDNFRQNLYGEFRPAGWFFGAMSVSWGETIDRSNSRQADFLTIEPLIDFRIGRNIEAEISHLYQTLDVLPGELFNVNLSQMKVLYHVNLRTFVRAIVQYESLDLNPSVYTFEVPDETEELFTQLLFSYKLNPQTVFLAGYSDGREGLDEVTLTQTDRTFFVKIGYAWLF